MRLNSQIHQLRSVVALPVEAVRRRREQWWPAARIAAVRNRRLSELLLKARVAPYYRRHVPVSDGARGDGPMALLAQLPLLDKRVIAENGLDAFLTTDRERLFTVTTSGSTGEPAVFLRSPREETEFSARWWRVFSAYGCSPRDTQVNLGRATTKSRRGVVEVLRKLGLVPKVVNLSSAAPIDTTAKTVSELKPQVLGGYAVAVESLADYVLQQGLEMPTRFVMCGAMDVTDHCREVAHRAFGAPVANVYVTNEMGVVAWSCPRRPDVLHVNEDVLVLEILGESGPVPDGVAGEVVLTSLTLEAMPLIRYRTGDIAARLPEPCGCGRGLGLMTAVQGRSAHAIMGSEGRLITAPLIANGFGACHAYDWVRRFQVREDRGAVLHVLLETKRRPSGEERGRLAECLQGLVGRGYTVLLEPVDAIPLAPSGKFQYVVPLPTSGLTT